MKISGKKQLPVLLTGIILLVATLIQALDHWAESSPWASNFNVISELKLQVYDLQVRLALRYPKPCATNLVAVFIDEPTVELLGDRASGLGYWARPPFPRHVYGRLVRELGRQGAKAVGLDVLFGDESPDDAPVPMSVTEARANSFTEADLAAYQKFPMGAPPNEVQGVAIESDHFFAIQTRQASNVVLAAKLEEGVVPIPLFRTNAYAIGDITSDPDTDGKLRRLSAYRDHYLWNPKLKRALEREGYRLIPAQMEIRSDRLIFKKGRSDRFVLKVDRQGYFNLNDLPRSEPDPHAPPREQAYAKVRYWHLGIVLAAKELGLDLTAAEIDRKNHRIVLRGKNRLERVIPVDSEGHFLINWALTWDDSRLLHINCGAILSLDCLRAAPADYAQYLQVLKKEGAKWKGNYPVKDKLVVVGSRVVGSNLSDVGPTPLSQLTYFVSTHWNVANALITGQFIRQSPYWLEWVLIMIAGMAAAWITWTRRALVALFWVLAMTVVNVALALLLYIHFRYWFPVVLPVLTGLLLHYVVTVTGRVIVEQQEKWRVRSVFAKLVAPEVVSELLGAEKLALGGARRQLTVFFSDVRGFTEMTDTVQARAELYVREHQLRGREAEEYFDQQAREVLATVNLYLSTIADRVKKNRGTLDKYMGDCVMAFWGAPVANERHAVDCVLSAIDSQRAIAELNQQRDLENQKREQENVERAKTGLTPLTMLPLLTMGSGINTGLVTVGLMGSDSHFVNYTVFGREVNLASRLEGVSGRGRIIISESTFVRLQSDDPALAAKCAPQMPVHVKGFHEDVKIYEVDWKSESLPIKDTPQ